MARTHIYKNYKRFFSKFYFGGMGGYGSTDWGFLVCKPDNTPGNQDCSDPASTGRVGALLDAKDKGGVYGGYIGFQMSPRFAVELHYTRYPDTEITIDEFSNYRSPPYNYPTHFTSHTAVYYFIGKFFVHIWHTHTLAYADAGASFIHRQDVMANKVKLMPTFGVGFKRPFNKWVAMEFGFQFHVGYDEATTVPALEYSPFLYSIFIGIDFTPVHYNPPPAVKEIHANSTQ